LLDEPLAALDAARREEVLPYLESLRDELAIPMVYVTHDFDEVMRLATHIVLMDLGSVVAEGTVGEMSLHPRLRSIIGPDQIGAIIDGTVVGIDPVSRLTKVTVGSGELNVQSPYIVPGTALRIQLLARDIILSTEQPRHLSVRNSLAGVVTRIDGDDADSDLITIDLGAQHVMARITKAATRELLLRPGLPVWALVKSVSLRGHSFAAPARAPRASATSPASPSA
jgi:molybdate transport system ATP-binding protein